MQAASATHCAFLGQQVHAALHGRAVQDHIHAGPPVRVGVQAGCHHGRQVAAVAASDGRVAACHAAGQRGRACAKLWAANFGTWLGALAGRAR